jgi:hypothetical protein
MTAGALIEAAGADRIANNPWRTQVSRAVNDVMSAL